MNEEGRGCANIASSPFFYLTLFFANRFAVYRLKVILAIMGNVNYWIKIKMKKFDKISSWVKVDEMNDYLHRYPLTSESLVVDIGCYVGHWLSHMNELYKCKFIGVEPIEEYANASKEIKFYNEAEILNFGLTTGDDGYADISIDNDASSLFNLDKSKKTKKIQLKNAKNFFDSIPKNIDLLQINAEGLEYELIPYIIDNNLIESVKFIQIQFHGILKNSDALMEDCIQKIESNGFTTSFNCPYIWYGAKRNNI